MLEDTAVHRRTAMVVIRHGREAPDFAAMVARELAKAGDAEGSRTWWSVSRSAKEMLSALAATPVAGAEPTHPERV